MNAVLEQMNSMPPPSLHSSNPLAGLTLAGGVLAVDFVNTVDQRSPSEPNDRLTSPADLVCWGNPVGLVTPDSVEDMLEWVRQDPKAAENVLARARSLREACFRLFSGVIDHAGPSSHDLDLLNRELREGASHRRLSIEASTFHWIWDEVEEPGHLLGLLAHSGVELLASGKLDRLGRCAAPTCDWLFLDVSRNRSRRWCDMAERGNRAKMRRYYRRQRGEE